MKRQTRAPFAFIVMIVLVGCAASARQAALARRASSPLTPAMIEAGGLAVQVIQTGLGIGTGVVVREDGYVLTNEHVVEIVCKKDAATGAETCSSGKYEVCRVIGGYQACGPAELIAVDKERDLALLKTPRTFDAAAAFADDAELQPLDPVFAWINVGLILPPTLFRGEFSGRVQPTYAPVKWPVLIFDLSANHGGSGGPIFNAEGEVVGILTGFTIVGTDETGIGNGAPLAVAVPASAAAAFVAEHLPSHPTKNPSR